MAGQIIYLGLVFCLAFLYSGCSIAMGNDEGKSDESDQQLQNRLQTLIQSLQYSQAQRPASEMDGIPRQVYEEIANLSLGELLEKHVVGANAELLSLLEPETQISVGDLHQREVSFNAAASSLSTSAAGCEPRTTTVALSQNNGHLTLQYPWCVEINRCGGCCYGNERMACQPTHSTLRTYHVVHLKLVAPRAAFFSIDGLHTRTLQEHHACECGCRVTSQMCTDDQRYDAERCACICKNIDQVTRCPWNKKWNNRLCTCVCVDHPTVCLEDEEYDARSCECKIKEISSSDQLIGMK